MGRITATAVRRSLKRVSVRKRLPQLAAVRAVCDVPLIASGGAGEEAHFLEVFEAARVDGALAASVFHSGELPIPELKRYLAGNDIDIRI